MPDLMGYSSTADFTFGLMPCVSVTVFHNMTPPSSEEALEAFTRFELGAYLICGTRQFRFVLHGTCQFKAR